MFTANKKILHINKVDLSLAVIATISFFTFVPFFTKLIFASDLNSKDTVMNKNDRGIILLDRKGRQFFTFYQAKKRTEVPLENIPKITQYATVAAEDKNFYTHPGYSWRSIIRSAIADFKSGDTKEGGSTITQQLVKNALLNPRKNLVRKYQEIILALDLEQRFSKDDLMSMYLNSVYFGEGAYGIEEAAQTYFGKNAKDLDLAESAMLVGLLPAPSKLSPISGDFNLTKERQRYVLSKMVEDGYISQNQARETLEKKLNIIYEHPLQNYQAPHFALMVKDELIKRYGEEALQKSGFKITTSIDLDWQDYAEKIVDRQVKNLTPNNVTNGAAVIMDPKTGEIKALVGSVNWDNENFGKVNVAISPRQPGSAFKPIVYAAAFEKHLITPATILKDQPTTFPGGYKPVDYDHKFRGPVTARRALANSLNVPSVEVISQLGVENAMNMAKKLGITTLNDPAQYGLSLVLGAGEVKLLDLTSAYAIFANNGYKNFPTTILKIQDKQDNIIYSYQPKPERILDPQYTFLISSILSDTKARSEVFGDALDLPRPAAVKTGTSENYRDSLTLGYTPSLAIGVWIGNNSGAQMDNVAGSLGAAPIWKALMTRFLTGTPVEKFEPPAEVVKETVCPGFTGRIATGSAVLEYFAQGSQNPNPCRDIITNL